MPLKIEPEHAAQFWRRGGYWVVFLLVWLVFAGIIGALENTQMNRVLSSEEKGRQYFTFMRGWLQTFLKPELEEDEPSKESLQTIMDYLGEEGVSDIFGKVDYDVVYFNRDVYEAALKNFKEDLEEVRDSYKKEDVELRNVAERAILLFSSNSSLNILHILGEQMREEAREAERNIQTNGHPGNWHFGHSLHFVSSIFTTTGFGGRLAMSAWGKFATVFTICTQLPFFIYCISMTAVEINKWLNQVLSDSSPDYSDMCSLTTEEMSAQVWVKRLVVMKGVLVLTAVVVIHLTLCAIYHFSTTGWSFGDVLYYQFVSYSSIGFGDLIPLDEETIGGAVLKALLEKIPSQILLLSLYLRVVPIII